MPGMSGGRECQQCLLEHRSNACRGELTTKDGQEQVDEEVGAAATLKEDTKRREHDGANDLDNVAAQGVSICCCRNGCCRRLPKRSAHRWRRMR